MTTCPCWITASAAAAWRLRFRRAGRWLRCWSGSVPSVPLAAESDLRYPLKEGERLQITARTPVSVDAPVVPGQAIGELCAYLDGEEVAKVPLVAAAPSADAKNLPLFFNRIWGLPSFS